MAVVAGMFAFSCVTDTTVDSTPTFESEVGGVKTVLSVGIANSEELRTQLGAWGETGYPMYWSNGDKISVNGVESNALALAEGATATAAEFGFVENLSTPYCIAYPAAAEGEVKFEANQSHANNTTFGNNVAAMWGYSENGEGIQLNHLTGVLKIGVVADEALVGKKLTYAQVSTIDRTPIAGDFAFDFAEGTLGEAVAATEVISYSFGEGVVLDATTPTYLHIAVPAGVYQELYVTLYDEDGGVMYATVKAGDNKPLAAGKVREFKKDGEEQLIKYAPNGEVHIVKDAASLEQLANNLDKDALFVADIDMTGKAWTPIEGYAKCVNGNGYAIKGLTNPLFGTTSATIRGLHLRDMAINITDDRYIVGGLACVLQSTETTIAKAEHCSVSGSLTFATTHKNTQDTYETAVGAMFGKALSSQISNCDNYASVAITKPSAATTSYTSIAVGGVVGYVGKASDIETLPSLTHCVNHESGDLSWNEAETNSANLKVYVSGICGVFEAASTINNLTNYGDVTCSSKVLTWGGSGVVGYLYANNASNLYNYGDITADCQITFGWWGGVIGTTSTSNNGTFSDCENHGKVEFTKNASCAATGRNYIGGVIAYPQAPNLICSGLKNSGAILSHGNCGNARFMCGGIVGYSLAKELNGCVNGEKDNTEKGKIIVTNSVGTTETGSTWYPGVGGVAGWAAPAGGSRLVTGCINYAPITLSYTTSGSYLSTIGGVVGHGKGAITQSCENYGAINCSGLDNTKKLQLLIGGVVGFSSEGKGEMKLCNNSGDITLGDKINCQLQLGGIVAYHQHNMSDCTNSGNITINGSPSIANVVYAVVRSDTGTDKRSDITSGNRSNIAGVLGKIWVNNFEATITNVKNTGAISFPQADSLNCVAIGGVFGELTCKSVNITTAQNEGNISIANTSNKAALVHIGGILARNMNTSIAGQTISLTNCTNKGNITLTEPKAINHVRAGGIVGDLLTQAKTKQYETTVTITNCVNEGNLSRTTQAASSTISYAGGILGSVGVDSGYTDYNWMGTNLTISGCTNKGSVQFDQYNGKTALNTTAAHNCYGGIVGLVYGGYINNKAYIPTITSCTNEGRIVSRVGEVGGIVGTIRDWGHIVGTEKAHNINKGEVVLDGTQNGYTGGIVGHCIATRTTQNVLIKYCTNEGAISARWRVGGIVGTSEATKDGTISHCVSLGNITLPNNDNATYVGGIIGRATNVGASDCISACYIKAYGYTGGHLGMVLAESRSNTNKATNCQIAGSIDKGYYGSYVDEFGTEKTGWTADVVDISATNFFNYIYSTAVTEDVAKGDGCSFYVAPTTDK